MKYIKTFETITNNPNPYINYSGIDAEYQKQGLGRYVYDLLEKQIGKKITHGDIASSVSAIKLWRKKLNDPTYLPDNFYDYWGEDVDVILKQLNENKKEYSIQYYIKQLETLTYKPLTTNLFNFISDEGWLQSLEDTYNKEYSKKDFEYTQLELSNDDKKGLINVIDDTVNKFNEFDIKLKEFDKYPFNRLDFIDYEKGIVYIIRIIKPIYENNQDFEIVYRGQKTYGDKLSYIWVSRDIEHAKVYGNITKYKMPKHLNILDCDYYDEWEELIDEFGEGGDYDEYKYEPSIEFMNFLQEKGYDGFENGDNILIFDSSYIYR